MADELVTEYDIILSRNGTWSRIFEIVNEDDEPYDIIGATFDLDVRYTPGQSGEPLISITLAVVGPTTDGAITAELEGSSFDAIGNLDRNLRLVYDLVCTQEGTRIPLLKGTLLLTPGVSDNEA